MDEDENKKPMQAPTRVKAFKEYLKEYSRKMRRLKYEQSDEFLERPQPKKPHEYE